MEITKKMEEFLECCKKEVENCFFLSINEQKAIINGNKEASKTISSALIIQKNTNGFAVTGFLDNHYFNHATDEKFMFPNPMLLGIDCRKSNNTKIYYQNSLKNLEKITSKTKMSSDDFLLIFLEYENVACLTFCCFDDLRNELIKDTISTTEHMLRGLLRGITNEYLQMVIPRCESFMQYTEDTKE